MVIIHMAAGTSPAAAEGPAARGPAAAQGGATALLPFVIERDAVPLPLGGLIGDPDRGRAIVIDRRKGNCLICHRLPVEGESFQGDIGPDLAQVGRRLRAGQIRLRLIDQSRINAETIMPPYYRTEGLTNVDPAWQGRPALEAQEIEDVVAFLADLGR